jgi:hypothetical protein
MDELGALNAATTCGTFVLSSINAPRSLVFTVHGRVLVAVTGDVIVRGGLVVVLDPDAELDLLIGGQLVASGGNPLGSASPARFRIWIAGSSSVVLDDAPTVGAIIRAPNAAVTATSWLQLSGALLAHSLTLGDQLSLHFDEAVASSGSPCGEPAAAFPRGIDIPDDDPVFVLLWIQVLVGSQRLSVGRDAECVTSCCGKTCDSPPFGNSPNVDVSGLVAHSIDENSWFPAHRDQWCPSVPRPSRDPLWHASDRWLGSRSRQRGAPTASHPTGEVPSVAAFGCGRQAALRHQQPEIARVSTRSVRYGCSADTGSCAVLLDFAEAGRRGRPKARCAWTKRSRAATALAQLALA